MPITKGIFCVVRPWFFVTRSDGVEKSCYNILKKVVTTFNKKF